MVCKYLLILAEIHAKTKKKKKKTAIFDIDLWGI